jgi:hypothetical protein
MDFISALQVNAFSVFLAIAAVGFLFLMISLFFGGLFDYFDGGLDHDVDHGGPGGEPKAAGERPRKSHCERLAGARSAR